MRCRRHPAKAGKEEIEKRIAIYTLKKMAVSHLPIFIFSTLLTLSGFFLFTLKHRLIDVLANADFFY